MPRSRWWLLAPIAMTAAIQVASGLPHPSQVTAEEGFSALEISASKVLFSPGEAAANLLHAPVFVALAWLWCWALGPWTRSRRSLLAVAAAVCLAFGVVNELSQLYVPTRTASLLDVLADAIGVAAGLAVFLLAGPARSE
ncbi:MAG TPA: VanZ family protein [Thermoanaerobaculia bacterium]|jgi:hypothetical protein